MHNYVVGMVVHLSTLLSLMEKTNVGTYFYQSILKCIKCFLGKFSNRRCVSPNIGTIALFQSVTRRDKMAAGTIAQNGLVTGIHQRQDPESQTRRRPSPTQATFGCRRRRRAAVRRRGIHSHRRSAASSSSCCCASGDMTATLMPPWQWPGTSQMNQ